MNRIARHVAIPALFPLLLVGLYFTPKDAFGCRNRGLMALAVVVVGLAGAFYASWRNFDSRRRGDVETANWWTVSMLLLLLPAVLLLGPLG